MNMSTFDPVVTLKLSIQRALLGEVTDRLVSVTCGIRNHVVLVRAYVEGQVREEDIERVSFIAAGVIADFPEPYMIEESCVSLKDGKEEMLDFWAFRRSRLDWRLKKVLVFLGQPIFGT